MVYQICEREFMEGILCSAKSQGVSRLQDGGHINSITANKLDFMALC